MSASELFTGPDAVARALAAAGNAKKFFVIDRAVESAHGERVASIRGDAAAFILPSGEAHKTINTALEICRAALAAGMDRRGVFVSIGGGVTCDLTGFAASVYMRGCAVIHIPTTLLAMVDAALGGKTAVDLPEGKNLIGTFHQPLAVGIEPEFLRTLPRERVAEGLAEMVKIGVVADGELFSGLEKAGEKVFSEGMPTDLIATACQDKLRVVAMDEKERGIRALLNYGHTTAHALEAVSNYGLSHGRAVAIGMAVAARLAARRGDFATDAEARQNALLKNFGLPLTPPKGVDTRQVLEFTRRDKKRREGKIVLVLPRDIGRAEVRDDVDEAEILSALGELSIC